MMLKQLLKKNLKVQKNKQKFLPSGFQRIGSIVILTLKEELNGFDKDIANIILENFGYVKSVYKKVSPIKGELRIPEIKYIAGEKNPITIHKESGCLFKIDVTKVMFSQGNLKERARLPGLVRDGETIVDMFAGIGYFSIPIAKAKPGCKIFAIEKNPESVKLLLENCRLNKVKNIEVIEGDCREVKLGKVADRVLMGYFPKTEKYLPAALSFLKPNGFIHYHNIYKENELWDKPIKELEKFGRVEVLYKAKVKSYAPRVWHVVIDFRLSQTP